jgi:hypothetical protein
MKKQKNYLAKSNKNCWLITFLLMNFLVYDCFAYSSYKIEVSHNDEFFLINGEKYKAKLYCFGMEEGDEVIFLSGRPNGVCVSAEIFNMRSKETCRVWCE